VRERADADGDIQSLLRPTTYEMVLTLFTLENPKRLPTGPLPPPTLPARPPFKICLSHGINIEVSIRELEAVVYHFTPPESLLPLFNEIGQIIWSNGWLRFFLIRQPHRLPVGKEMFYGVLRWWSRTDELVMAAFLKQKMDPGLKAEVNYYIPAARGIKTFNEWNEMLGRAIDDVAKVRRKLRAGVAMVFHTKLAAERDKAQKDTPSPTLHERRATRSSLHQELHALQLI
jgi:hypothetical protein